ncbi:MAG: hypothetical protein A2Y38_16420 [Spirochaetes bacterium GWB1_59_5]|nr:MAG: hypothetical protein A2Y38_16420 [Spirochaetes bacterium GWB1_59_5]
MANRVAFFFRQKVTGGELNLALTELEDADRALTADLNMRGILSGLTVITHASPGFVNIAPGGATDFNGKRIAQSGNYALDIGQDSSAVSTAVVGSGNERIVSIFLKAARNQYDPRTDGSSPPLTIFFRNDEAVQYVVRAGVEAVAGAAIPPALEGDGVLVADVTRTFGQTTIPTLAIDLTGRRQDCFVLPGTPYAIRRGLVSEVAADLLNFINTGSDKLIRRGITNTAVAVGLAGYVSSTNTVGLTDASALANPTDVSKKARFFGVNTGIVASSMVVNGVALATFTGGLVAGDAGNPAWLAKGDGAGGGDAGKLERDVSVFSVDNDVIAEVGIILEVVNATSAYVLIQPKTPERV